MGGLNVALDDRPGEATDFHGYVPEMGHGLEHNPLLAIVGPRPIGWISTVSAEGHRNLAPFSFFNLLRPAPPLLAFSVGGAKDSLANVRETGRFVWNLVTRPLAEAMNMTSVEVPYDVDEFKIAELDCGPSSFGMPGYVAKSPVSMDCVVTEIVEMKDRHGDFAGSTLIIGEAVYIRIARYLLNEGNYDALAAQPVLRGGGPSDYFEVKRSGHFAMQRPQIQP